MENIKLIEGESGLPEKKPEIVPIIIVDHGPLGRRVLNFFTGLPALIPAVKRRRERKRLIEHRERRRDLFRKAMREAAVPIRTRKTGPDPEDWEIDRDNKYEVEAEIKYVETKCNVDLSRINARIDAIDFYKLAKRADKYGVPVPDAVIIDETNGERYSPSTWVELLERRETAMSSKEKIQLRNDVQAKRYERRKQRNETLVPVLTAATALISTLVALAALLLKK
jgi:hypothetical protein